MDRTAIVDKVKVIMDELTPFDTGLVVSSGVDYENTVEKYIDELLNQSATQLLKEYPMHRLQKTNIAQGDITIAADGKTTITLPANYLRLAYAVLSGWQRAVTETMTENHPQYPLQANPYTRGKMAKPVVIENIHESTLETYAKPTDGDKGTVRVIIDRLPEELSDHLIDPLTWLCASKVFQVYEMDGPMKAAIQNYQNYLITDTK